MVSLLVIIYPWYFSFYCLILLSRPFYQPSTYNLLPIHMPRLGQHFLRDQSVLRVVVAALDPQPGETIIEIGAGHGELTEEVVGCRLKVKGKPIRTIAVEKDLILARALRKKFPSYKNISVVEGDVRKILPTLTLKLQPSTYKICGNIPYYLTGFLFRLISSLNPRPSRVVLTIQKEVADRVVARPPRMNRIAASVQFWAKPKIIRAVPRGAFSPPPKVESAILLLKTQIGADGAQINADTYYAAVRALFAQPRKTIMNNITNAIHISKEDVSHILLEEGVELSARPQNLSITQIAALASQFTFK